MNCPACSRELKTIQATPSISVDVCSTGCGGMWFDRNELSKLDEKTELQSAAVLRTMRNAEVVLDYARERRCPKCHTALDRIAYDSTHQVEVDECRDCQGIWLDIGELESIHDDNEREALMHQVVEETKAKSSSDATGKLSSFVKLLFQ